MRYKGSSRPLPQIAGELGVSLVVQGSVLRVGNRVRITAQLIRAAPEQQLWARSYERDLRDVLTLQKEVAEAITQEIRVKIEPEDRRHLATGRLVDPQAYDAYLRGRYAWNRRTNESVVQSLQSFQEALDRDPQLALAHAGLAAAYAWAGGREVLSPEESFRKARQHAKAALEIDPGLADAHASLGYVQMRADRDWQGAEASFRRAIALQPNHAAAHFFYWVYLFARGRQPEAREQIRLAAELDPLSTIVTINLGLADLLDGNEAEALRLWKKAQMLDPDLPSTYVYLSSYYLQKGELEMSRQSFRKVLALRYAEIVPQMNQASRAGGDKAALKAAVKALEDLSRRRPVPSEDIAWVYLLLGQRGKALDWLEKAYEQNSPATIFFRNDWTWRSLRSEPRFQALIKKIG
jgi:Tfp pilus assembly protein PilF